MLEPNQTLGFLTFIIEVVDQVEDEIARTLSIPLSALGVRLGRELRDELAFRTISECLCGCHLR